MSEGKIMTRIATAFTAALALAATAVHAETVVSVTQTSYDNNNRPTCTTVRMNPATYGALPSSACTLATEHATYGPDRITKSTYDNAGQVTQVDQAYGTSVQRAYARYSYSNNGLKTSEKDVNGNLTTLEYDGFDRLKKLRYPNTTIGAGTSSTTDYEDFGYDANDRKISWRRRNSVTIAYGYDNLGRTIVEDQPTITGVQTATEKDVHTSYDSLGRLTSKRFVSTSGNGVSYGYDSLGRTTSTTDINGRSLGYGYNSASAVAAVTYPDSYVFSRSLDNLNRVTQVYNGSTVFYSQAYTSRGLRKKLLRGAAIASGELTDAACAAQTNATSYSYDALGRLTSMSHELSGTTNDITWSFSGRNPANQITSWDASSTNYDYDEQVTTTVNKTYDGLNRDSGIAAISGGYDANGNLGKESLSASDKRCMTYDVLNRLTAVAWCNAQTTPFLTLAYDTEGRLAANTASGQTTEFVYDGVNLIAEYKYTGAYNGNTGGETMTQRYVHGTGVDEPLVWYAGAAVTSPNFLLANYQGSIIGYSNSSGALTELYRYDPYGWPTSSSNSKFWYGSRFRYTGQYAIPEAELYYYKARVYDPMYGRFLQTDPIGSKDDLNLYAYVRGDPVNLTDPTGLQPPDMSHKRGSTGGLDWSVSGLYDAIDVKGEIVAGLVRAGFAYTTAQSLVSKFQIGVYPEMELEYNREGVEAVRNAIVSALTSPSLVREGLTDMVMGYDEPILVLMNNTKNNEAQGTNLSIDIGNMPNYTGVDGKRYKSVPGAVVAHELGHIVYFQGQKYAIYLENLYYRDHGMKARRN